MTDHKRDEDTGEELGITGVNTVRKTIDINRNE
jgi:hypothetical protein